MISGAPGVNHVRVYQDNDNLFEKEINKDINEVIKSIINDD